MINYIEEALPLDPDDDGYSSPQAPSQPRSMSQVEDPFGDSFSPPPSTYQPSSISISKLPPPPSSTGRTDSGSASAPNQKEHWFDKETRSVFENEPFGQSSQVSGCSILSLSSLYPLPFHLSSSCLFFS
jgi:hypothetical protein